MKRSEGISQPNAEVPEEGRAPSIRNKPAKEFRRKATLPASSNRSANRVPAVHFEETEKVAEKQSCADWRYVYEELENAIKMRHYSPKTLKSYIGYTRQFQAFVKSKGPKLAGVDDVKGFLTIFFLPILTI